MSIDMYSEKTIEATTLIKQVTGLDWFYALDTNSQETLERFIACMDKVKADILASLPAPVAPLSADTDKLRETFEAAWPEIYKAGMDHGWRGIAWASWQSCAASTPLQAPVREVPEADLWELLPNDAWYLDPPDGGNVSLMEQLRRMSVDAAEWRKLARVGRAPKWISVSDKLPEFRHECTTSGCEVSDSILIYGETEFGTTGCGFGHARDDGTWQCYEAEYDQLTVSKVTHWMPLPAAPVQPEGE